MTAPMIFDRLYDKSFTQLALGEPLSNRGAWLVIAVGSILGWAVFIAGSVGLVRLAGHL